MSNVRISKPQAIGGAFEVREIRNSAFSWGHISGRGDAIVGHTGTWYLAASIFSTLIGAFNVPCACHGHKTVKIGRRAYVEITEEVADAIFKANAANVEAGYTKGQRERAEEVSDFALALLDLAA